MKKLVTHYFILTHDGYFFSTKSQKLILFANASLRRKRSAAPTSFLVSYVATLKWVQMKKKKLT